ncbi:MAG: 2-phospho-L-lactate transferase [Chloroflexi bacterium]|nr:MAG: 2-phospho-L-lactate transferase [Chloroflexota bacterium]
MRVAVLAGGTGGARLAAGFDAVLPPGDLTVIANTADDDEFWGLLVCPDIDAVIYRLAGIFNDESGFGQRNESFHVLDSLERLGEPAWFRLGDKDLATHVLRAELLRSGSTLTNATLELCRRFGIRSRVLPMSDQPVRTRCITERGTYSLQEYFVRERLSPVLKAIEFEGLESASMTTEVKSALAAAELVVIGPSNPRISIDPILQVLAAALVPDRTTAGSPIGGGAALDATPLEVARRYREVSSRFALDQRDREYEPAIAQLGYRVLVCDTVMSDGGRSLAEALVG